MVVLWLILRVLEHLLELLYLELYKLIYSRERAVVLTQGRSEIIFAGNSVF
jgi:hypothetical protein